MKFAGGRVRYFPFERFPPGNPKPATKNGGLQVLWRHASVVRKKFGFDSRVDLLHDRGRMYQGKASLFCKQTEMGSIPLVSTV